MKLKYVGAGRYLNGVPARDHEQNDPSLIALALGSGLYASEDESHSDDEVAVSQPVRSTGDGRRSRSSASVTVEPSKEETAVIAADTDAWSASRSEE